MATEASGSSSSSQQVTPSSGSATGESYPRNVTIASRLLAIALITGCVTFGLFIYMGSEITSGSFTLGSAPVIWLLGLIVYGVLIACVADGKNWARITMAILVVAITFQYLSNFAATDTEVSIHHLSGVTIFAISGAPTAPAPSWLWLDMLPNMLVHTAQLTALALLFSPSANAWFSGKPAEVSAGPR